MDLNDLQIGYGFALALVLGVVLYFLRALTVSGTVGTVIVGTIFFGLGGWIMTVPLLFFFVSASILSRIKSGHKSTAMRLAEKTGARDIWQVLANGGAASVALIVFRATGSIVWLAMSLAAICEAAADTWATEIGTIRKVGTVSIINFKSLTPGQSGGVSLNGTMASLAGSALTGLAFYLAGGGSEAVMIWLAASLAGFLGSVIDSVLGATVQGRYFDAATNRHSESKTPGSRLNGGISWVKNDLVNLAGTLFAAGFAAIFCHLTQIN